MKHQLDEIKKQFFKEFENVSDIKTLDELRVRFLGKKGELTSILKGMRDLDPESRKEVGKISNVIKTEIEDSIKRRVVEIEEQEIATRLDSEWIDITWPAEENRGTFHPLTTIRERIEDIFVSMGFEVLTGPEMEEEQNNFDNLNIPADHPARDMQDTFWLNTGKLLRTHTSSVQVRGMKERTAPSDSLLPGRCTGMRPSMPAMSTHFTR